MGREVILHTTATMIIIAILFLLLMLKIPLCVFKIHTFLRVVWGYFLIRAIVQAYYPFEPDYLKGLVVNYSWVSAQSAIQLMLMPLLVYLLDTKKLIKLLKIICTANLVFLIATYKTKGTWYTGNTMDAAICTMFLMSSGWPYRILNLISFIFVGGSTAIIMAGTQVFARFKKYWPVVLSLGLLLAYLVKTFAPSFFDPSDRLVIWKYSMSFWEARGNKLFGEGLGAYTQLGPILGEANHTHNYMWMHNDWLQLLFDAGFIGLFLALGLYVATLWKARTDSILLGQVLSFGVMMFLYAPLRLIIGQVILCLLIKQVWSTHEKVFKLA